MEKILNIVPPEGWEIDKDKSTIEKIIFKEKETELPKTWKELKRIKGYFITSYSHIQTYENTINNENKNTFPTKELAEAALALSQLLQLRDRYNDDWKSDWTDCSTKYCIYVYGEELKKEGKCVTQRIMHFRTKELRDLFFTNFKNLLEIAKPLL